jgi:hypothetical protein
MKSNKAPGLDGLTVEFFREFWGKVNFFLIDVLNKSYDEKLLSMIEANEPVFNISSLVIIYNFF